MRTAIDKFKDAVDTGQIPTTELEPGSEGYPPDLETLVEGVSVPPTTPSGRKLKFLRRVPIDPMTNSTEWGLRSYQDTPDSTSWGGQNVFDVYTKSAGTGARRDEVQGLVDETTARGDATTPQRRLHAHRADDRDGDHRHPGGHRPGDVRQQRHSGRKEAVLKEDLFRMRDAIDQYYADKNKYPASLEALVAEKYLRAVPVDPFTQLADTWQTTMSEPDPERRRRAGHLRREERIGRRQPRRHAYANW